MIFYIKDERQIDVEVIGPRDAAYDAFLEDLQKGGSGECRYGLFDFEYTHQCQGTSEVIIWPYLFSYKLMICTLKVLLKLDNKYFFKSISLYVILFLGIQETEIVPDVVVSRHGQG